MAALPVLLVHGFASSFERSWRDTGWADVLADTGREVIAVDLPGHGTADKPHDPEAYRDLHLAVEAALPAGPVDAVGFSLGAGLLLAVAAQAPERFGRLVMGGVGGSVLRTEPGGVEEVAQALLTGRAGPEASGTAQAFARFASAPGNDPEALAACLRRPWQPLTAEALAAVRCPVLVVIGDRDPAGPVEPLVDALPDAVVVVLPGADHFATAKDVRFLDAALHFLDAA